MEFDSLMQMNVKLIRLIKKVFLVSGLCSSSHNSSNVKRLRNTIISYIF